MLIQLAQDPSVAAERWVAVLKVIVDGGPELILASVSAICGWAFYKQLVKNNLLEREFRTQVKDDAEAKGDTQKELMLQMLQREHEVQEGQLAAVQAVETFSVEMREVKKNQIDILRRLRAIEDEIRRFPRGIGN